MVTRTVAVRSMLDVAAFQHGAVTGAQAEACGVSRPALTRMAADGLLARLRHGVYLLRGAGDLHDDLRAAWLQLDPAQDPPDRLHDPSAVVSHASAAWVHGLGELMAERHEFTLARPRRTRYADVTFHRAQLAAGEWQVAEGMAVTTPARTIADLAAGQLDGGHLASIVADAVRAGQLTEDAVAEALSGHAVRYDIDDDGSGRQFLAYLLALEGAGSPATALPATAAAASRTAHPLQDAHQLARNLCLALGEADRTGEPLSAAQMRALLEDGAAVTGAFNSLTGRFAEASA